jgi:hypothetical protein
MKFTHVNNLPSLALFYDIGRIPLTIGWGNGRVSWIGQKGSKWINFHTWGGFRLKVFERDNGICKKCGKVIAKLTDKGYWDCNPDFICDHIVPLFKGGKDWHEDSEMLNFQTLCVQCNKVKTRSDVAKPKVVKQKLNLKVTQYAGFIFETVIQKDNPLEKYFQLNDVIDSKQVK